jgi:hypothetical protein
METENGGRGAVWHIHSVEVDEQEVAAVTHWYDLITSLPFNLELILL